MLSFREIRFRVDRLVGRTSTRKYSMIFGVLVLATFLAVFSVEVIHRGTFGDAITWSIENPALFVINFLLGFLAMLLIYCMVGSLIVSIAITTFILFIFALVSFFKAQLVGEPLFPWDILLNKQMANLIPYISEPLATNRFRLAIIIVLVLFLLRLVIPRLSMPLTGRVLLGLLSAFALYSFGLKTEWAGDVMDRLEIDEIVWNQKQNYDQNGATLAFTLNFKNVVVSKPAGYGELSIANLAQIMSEMNNATSTEKNVPDTKKPNVIFIMNEAFWDPMLLPNIELSEDPIPTFRRLQNEGISGYLLTPQFGGSTSNVEFEVLTGNNMSFLPAGSIPYQQYVNKPLPSLASYFQDQGYRSMAMHSYEGWFWNRDYVYRQMGFEGYLSMEYFDNPEYKGYFISDAEVTRHIINEVERSESPAFIYAITMQNHGPYNDDRYGEKEIRVQGDLTEEARQIIETYTQGTRDADDALASLVAHFEQSGEPTMIIFFGDHLPMLGWEYDAYVQAGFIYSGQSKQWTLDELLKMHSVPFVIWTNYSLPQQHVPIMSTSFVGAFVLELLNVDLPAPFRYHTELLRTVPGILRDLVVDANRTLHRSVPEYASQDVERYKELQYDLLFGKKYLANYMDYEYLTKPPLPNFNVQFQ